MTTLEKITKKAKSLRRANPSMKYVDAQRQAAAMLSGVKKKKKRVGNITVVSGVKRKIASPGKAVGKVKRASSGKSDSYASGLRILSKIDSMEADLKKAKGNERKNFIKLEINKLHDKLDGLKK